MGWPFTVVQRDRRIKLGLPTDQVDVNLDINAWTLESVRQLLRDIATDQIMELDRAGRGPDIDRIVVDRNRVSGRWIDDAQRSIWIFLKPPAKWLNFLPVEHAVAWQIGRSGLQRDSGHLLDDWAWVVIRSDRSRERMPRGTRGTWLRARETAVYAPFGTGGSYAAFTNMLVASAFRGRARTPGRPWGRGQGWLGAASKQASAYLRDFNLVAGFSQSHRGSSLARVQGMPFVRVWGKWGGR